MNEFGRKIRAGAKEKSRVRALAQGAQGEGPGSMLWPRERRVGRVTMMRLAGSR